MISPNLQDSVKTPVLRVQRVSIGLWWRREAIAMIRLTVGHYDNYDVPAQNIIDVEILLTTHRLHTLCSLRTFNSSIFRMPHTLWSFVVILKYFQTVLYHSCHFFCVGQI